MSNWVIDVYFSHVILRVLGRYGIALAVEGRESLDDFLVKYLSDGILRHFLVIFPSAA